MHYILPVQTQLAFELNFRLTTLIVEKKENERTCARFETAEKGESLRVGKIPHFLK